MEVTYQEKLRALEVENQQLRVDLETAVAELMVQKALFAARSAACNQVEAQWQADRARLETQAQAERARLSSQWRAERANNSATLKRHQELAAHLTACVVSGQGLLKVAEAEARKYRRHKRRKHADNVDSSSESSEVRGQDSDGPDETMPPSNPRRAPRLE